MIARELQATLRKAFDEAQAMRHEYVPLEHLLLALLDDRPSGRASFEIDPTSSALGETQVPRCTFTLDLQGHVAVPGLQLRWESTMGSTGLSEPVR